MAVPPVKVDEDLPAVGDRDTLAFWLGRMAMRRRTFIAALVGVAAWPLPARAQRAGIVGSLLPAWRAVRLVPTEALRRT
jgi:hypothetical protein